jgi:hypothetical protein
VNNWSGRRGFELFGYVRPNSVFILLARLKGQRLDELNRDTAQIVIYVVNPADVSGAAEIGHVKRVVLAVAWDAEAGGYVLAERGTRVIGPAGERSASAGNIYHLALRQLALEVLRKPDGPMITQSLLCSAVGVVVHFLLTSRIEVVLLYPLSPDHPKPSVASVWCANRPIQRPTLKWR